MVKVGLHSQQFDVIQRYSRRTCGRRFLRLSSIMLLIILVRVIDLAAQSNARHASTP